MAGQIQWTISLVMLGLFVIAIIGFMMGFATDNNAAVNIASDQQINTLYTNTKSNTTTFNAGSEGTYASIVNSTISSGDNIASGSPFAITPLSIVGVVSNILRVGYHKIFGTNSGFDIFLITFLALIVFITAMLIWKTWGGRTPD